MKKMILGAAATLLCGSVFAAIESANIVGYVNNDLVEGGQLVSASFLKPGSNGFNVSDIKISGYQEDLAFYEAADYACDFYILDYAGRTIKGEGKYFMYIDTWDWDEYAFLGGTWFDYQMNEVVPGGANDATLSPAQAIWLALPGGDGEHTVTFGTAGEVIQDDVDYTLTEGGNCVGNPMAIGVPVSSLSVSGYEEDLAFYEAADYACDFYILDYAGRTIKEEGKYFMYIDTWDWDEYAFLGGTWFDYQMNEVVPGGANDAILAPGQGLWFAIPGGDGEHTNVLKFPAITLK